jgi:histidinol-phosphate aminotransferase
MLQKTYKFFNQSTRLAFFERVKGYVSKSYNNSDEIDSIALQYNLEKIYRFDLGENVIGCSPIVHQFMQRLQNSTPKDIPLNNYPEIIHRRIRKRIAEYHHVDANSVVISTGLDAIIDLISRVFFDPKDYYLSLVPSFYLFEEYSERMGAIPIFLELNEEDNFLLTAEKLDELKELVEKFKPKIIWIANPNNPTGQVIHENALEEIIKVAERNNSFVVIDEAYIEFLPDFKQKSTMQFVNKYSNLMVLRTFSKAFGLAGMRIGYLISSSSDIINAMLMLRSHFPVTQLALTMASIALNDECFLEDSRKYTKAFSKELFTSLKQLKSFRCIPSETNIFIVKNIYLSEKELDQEFRKRGIISSYVNFPAQNERQYLRITIRDKNDNRYFYNVCQQIDSEVVINFHSYYKSKFKHLPLYNTKYLEPLKPVVLSM